MKLTQLLWRKRMPNGNIWGGKHHIVRGVSPMTQEALRKKLDIEEMNMFYLRHPYLTYEQSKGHVQALAEKEGTPGNKTNPFGKLILQKYLSNVKPHVTLEDRLFHLKVTEAWD